MKRGKSRVLFAFVAAVILLAVTSCPNMYSTYEFEGTWSYLAGLQTWQFSSSGGSTSLFAGALTVDFTYMNVDTSARHIQILVTSVVGIGSPPAGQGAPLYLTYSISGPSMYLSFDPSAFPSSASTGPYIRQ